MMVNLTVMIVRLELNDSPMKVQNLQRQHDCCQSSAVLKHDPSRVDFRHAAAFPKHVACCGTRVLTADLGDRHFDNSTH